MKLYAVPHSPFAARVRLALRVKGLAYEMEPPPGGSTRSPEYLALNPIGKLPVLVTDDGLKIAESETIIDYLDEIFPVPSLIPAGVAERAQMRNAIRTIELYVVPAALRLFGQLDPAKRNDSIVIAELANMSSGLSLVENFVDDAVYVTGNAISKADCIVLPTLILCDLAGHLFGANGIVSEFEVLSRYAAKARSDGRMLTIWDETSAALAKLTG
ncbi:glutathione S-transferase family protein [Novosphingobium taihuense]|uniref:Glutathione S-transferase n=1 Tax=Novosphingobium taihuense TaxID=260085 RepID=A0A7W7EUC1_9SPHN|nr:glutathione S-transferase family protein [Novosphingobium taihuense]MBB4614253.1 glutathione S-transferase [Novosphingobium taihuense]TWH87100.1 glutathione S-transferase [Novosphingobium taihuense]